MDNLTIKINVDEKGLVTGLNVNKLTPEFLDLIKKLKLKLNFEDYVKVARVTMDHFKREPGETTVDTMIRYFKHPDIGDMFLRLCIHIPELMATWDAVNGHVENLLREGKPLSPELAAWLAEHRTRPTKRGPNPARYFMRNYAIVRAVKVLTELGMTAKRSNTRGGTMACKEGGSACDAVGEAMNMGYTAVRKIWDKQKDSVPSILTAHTK